MINPAVRSSARNSRRQAYPHQVARALPRTGLLLYLGRPNLEAADVPLGDDTEIGDDTIIRWMFLLPADADIRAATGWVSGVGNIFYDAAGDPVAVLASEIAAWSSINQWNVLFHLVSADTESGRLAVYSQGTPLATLNKALKVLREDQIDVSPSAFFNGVDTTGKTSYTGGPTYVPDNLGVLRTPGANVPAIQGARLDGPTYYDTTLDGTPIVTRTSQPTRTFDAGFTTATPSTTFKRYNTSDTRPNVQMDMPGFLCEPARTNKCTCRKSNPVDTTGLSASNSGILSVVSGQEALIAAAGLSDLCNSGKLYRILNNNATDSKVSFAGFANTNNHSVSLYAISITGTSKIRFNLVSYESFPSTHLGKLTKENLVSLSTSQLVLDCSAYSDTYFILPQLEEGAFCTSPICKAADGSDPLAPITRAGTVLTYPTLGKIRSNNMAFRMIVVPLGIPVTAHALFHSAYSLDHHQIIYFNGTNLYASRRFGGASISATLATVPQVGVPLEVLAIFSATRGIVLTTRNYSGGWGSWRTPATNTTADGKRNSELGSTYLIGNSTDASFFTGNITLFDTLLIPDGITDPLAWAKTQWKIV